MKHAGLNRLLLDMIKTVPPVPKTVDELVEEYRVKLGIRLWSELGHGRRSGRTTHMMLVAIATAVTTGKQVVVSFDEAGFDRSKDDLFITARAVGVDKSLFIVVPHQKAERASHTLREKLVVFSDHHDSRYRFSSR